MRPCGDEKMTNERSRHLPVISHEKLVGLVSIGDMVKYRLGECSRISPPDLATNAARLKWGAGL
jgi:CBS domain-containing protein